MPHVKYSIPRLSVLLLQIESHIICSWVDVNNVLLTVYDQGLEGSDSKLL